MRKSEWKKYEMYKFGWNIRGVVCLSGWFGWGFIRADGWRDNEMHYESCVPIINIFSTFWRCLLPYWSCVPLFYFFNPLLKMQNHLSKVFLPFFKLWTPFLWFVPLLKYCTPFQALDPLLKLYTPFLSFGPLFEALDLFLKHCPLFLSCVPPCIHTKKYLGKHASDGRRRLMKYDD